MTMLSLVTRLGPCLGETTLVYALAAAARTVAGNCAGQPMRHSPGRLNGEGYGEERLSEWMFHWAKVRHDEAAERTLLTAVACGLTREALNRMVFGPIQERVYADGMQYHDHHKSDSCPQKQDPADWYASSYTRHPVEDLEPLNEEPNSYRKAALGYLQILLAVDAYMARSKDGVIAWVSIAIVLRLHSVKGLTTANIASQLGCTESQLERSCSRFKRLLPADGVPRDVWHSSNGNGANHSTNGSER